MSSTATTTRTRAAPTRTAETILSDYALHHSQQPQPSDEQASRSPQQQQQRPETPPWDTTHRRVPPYRPTNRDRDPAETGVYLSRAEQVFVTMMFTGVSINAVRPDVSLSQTEHTLTGISVDAGEGMAQHCGQTERQDLPVSHRRGDVIWLR